VGKVIKLALSFKTTALVAERDGDGFLPVELAKCAGHVACATLLVEALEAEKKPDETLDQMVSSNCSCMHAASAVSVGAANLSFLSHFALPVHVGQPKQQWTSNTPLSST